mgnify:CR=1 FL=1
MQPLVWRAEEAEARPKAVAKFQSALDAAKKEASDRADELAEEMRTECDLSLIHI